MAAIVGFLESTLADGAVAAALVMAVSFLARDWLTARLAGSIRLETETRLEEIRTASKIEESRLTSITAAGIDSIHQIAASAGPERIIAVKAIWSAMLRWRAANAISMVISATDLAWVRKNGANPSTKTFFAGMLKTLNHDELLRSTSDTEKHRPLVSEQAWTLYYAYHSFHVFRMMKATILSTGFTDELATRIWSLGTERDLVATASTDKVLAAYDRNVQLGTNEFLSYLQSEIVIELRRNLSGDDYGLATAAQAASIIKVASALMRTVESEPPNLPG